MAIKYINCFECGVELLNKYMKRCDSCRLFRMLDKKLARKCNSAVNVAIKAGELIRSMLCDLCELEDYTEAHHTDYSDPFNVLWLCKDCHVTVHRALKSYSYVKV